MASGSKPSKTTLLDIANRVGVSPATVSLALRNKPGVGHETRQRVIQSAATLGYTVSSASRVSSSAVDVIGVLVKVPPIYDGMTSQFYGPVLSGIETVCRERHINLLYGHLEVDQFNTPVQTPRMLFEDTAGGLLIVGIWLDEMNSDILRSFNAPLVLVDSYARTSAHDAVLSANETGSYEATRHLIALGHRQIVMVGGSESAFPSRRERRIGYARAVSEAGLPAYFADCNMNAAEVEQAVQTLLQDHPQITAIVGCNDVVAISAIQTLNKMGLRVPDDLSVIGYDDISLAEHVSPALTTMGVDKRRMGRMAVELLLDRLRNPESANVRAEVIPELVERSSTALPVAARC